MYQLCSCLALTWIMFLISIPTSHAQQPDGSGLIEITANGDISITPSLNHSVLVNGPLQLASMDESSTLTASLLNELFTSVKELQSECTTLNNQIYQLMMNVSDLQRENSEMLSTLTSVVTQNAALVADNAILLNNITTLNGRLSTFEEELRARNTSTSTSSGNRICGYGNLTYIGPDFVCICPVGWTGGNCEFYVGGCGFYDLAGNRRSDNEIRRVSPCHLDILPKAKCFDTDNFGSFQCVCEGCASCSEIQAYNMLFNNSLSVNGVYLVDIDDEGPLSPSLVYCDFITDGGGWTILASYTGGDNEQPITGDIPSLSSNPLQFYYYNLNRAAKELLSTQNGAFPHGRGETLLKRNSGAWLKSSSPPFDGGLRSGVHAYNLTASTVPVVLQASSGERTPAVQGYTTQEISGGGDFGITQAETAFDFTNPTATMTNSACFGNYIYSFSSGVLDGDAGYDTNIGLGNWSVTQSCSSGEAGHLSFYIAVRDPTLFGSCSSSPCRNGGSCLSNPSTGYNCTCAVGFTGHHCDVALCPSISTHSWNGKCFLGNPNSVAGFSSAALGCQAAGNISGNYDWHLASGRGSTSGSRLENQLLVDELLGLPLSDSGTNLMWTGGFGYYSSYYWLDGSNNPSGNVIQWTSSYPQLQLASSPWPIIILRGGSVSNRYHVEDRSSSSLSAPSVCSRFQQPAGRCRPAEVYWQGSCYNLQTTNRDWDTAENFCISQGGHLVTINSVTEQAFLVVEFQLTASTLIGLKVANGLTYYWVSGSMSSFRFWDNHGYQQPDGSPCCYMWNISPLMMWDDWYCGQSTQSICERPADMISY